MWGLWAGVRPDPFSPAILASHKCVNSLSEHLLNSGFHLGLGYVQEKSRMGQQAERLG